MNPGSPVILEGEPVPPAAGPDARADSVACEDIAPAAIPLDPNAALNARGTDPACAIDDWTDAALVAAIRADPPATMALNELAQRYWKPLFAHCQMIALNRADAADLAQDAWRRVLKARHNLKPEGNFPGYLRMIAMNLWRDRCRSENRAGALAANRVISLDGSVSDEDGGAIILGDAVPDLFSLEADQQARLTADIDAALGQLSPTLRGVLVARFLMGESCAEIGRRHGRTEQAVSGWVRTAVQEMKKHLLELRGGLSLGGVS
jgi:RNA polymerase sigma factor (sigma-70 family)